jgi:hypothetical protein
VVRKETRKGSLLHEMLNEITRSGGKKVRKWVGWKEVFEKSEERKKRNNWCLNLRFYPNRQVCYFQAMHFKLRK